MTDVTYCINTETGDVSEWDVAFYRVWNVNGVMYGFTANGMYELSGQLDDTVPISCSITTSPQDDGNENLKRVPYARAETQGKMDITLLLDKKPVSTFTMDAINSRAKFARGAKGRFVSFKIDSTDPEFNIIDLNPNVEKQKRGYL